MNKNANTNKYDNNLENKDTTQSFFISTYGCQMNEEDSEKLQAC